MRLRTALLTVLLTATVTTGAQAPPPSVQALINDPAFKTATGFLEKDHDRFVRELITLTEVPAPPFKEKARGQAILGVAAAAVPRCSPSSRTWTPSSPKAPT